MEYLIISIPVPLITLFIILWRERKKKGKKLKLFNNLKTVDFSRDKKEYNINNFFNNFNIPPASTWDIRPQAVELEILNEKKNEEKKE